MSHHISEDCSSGIHDYCTPCQCECHDKYQLTVKEMRAFYNLIKHHYIPYEDAEAKAAIDKLERLIKNEELRDNSDS